MFNNKFNSSKKDPLVEAVENAMKDGNLRREAERLVNEHFGVFSRKAVVRENLAAYDAALEEAYKCMKEDEKWEGSKEDTDEDKKLAKKHGMTLAQWEKSDADKKHDKHEKNEKKKHGKDIDEELAKKDYDKDGKVESGKDEVWGSRLRAARLAGKLKEGAIDAGSMEGSKSVTKSAPKEDPSTPKSYPGAASSLTAGNPTSQRMSNAKAAVSPIKEGQADPTGNAVTAPKEWAMKAKTPNKNAVTKAPVPGVSIAEEEIDEAAYSAKAARAGKDLAKPGPGFKRIAAKAGKKYGSKERGAAVAGAVLKRIRAKHMEESAQIDEVSKRAAIHAYRERESQHRGEYNQGWGSEGQDPNDDYGERSGKKASKTLSRIGKKFGSKTAAQAKHGAEIDSSGRGHKGGTDYLAAKQSVYSKFSRPNSKKGTKERKEYMSMNKGRFTKEETLDELSGFEKAFASAKGKNFSFGGKEYSGARADGKTSSTPKPAATNTPGTQGVATGKSFDAIDKAKSFAAKVPSATNVPTPPKKPESLSLPSIDKGPAPGPASVPTPAPKAAPSVPTPPSRPAGLGNSEPGSGASSFVRKQLSMNEEVQVGTNKYRIV
jgi:hypothetical protein